VLMAGCRWRTRCNSSAQDVRKGELRRRLLTIAAPMPAPCMARKMSMETSFGANPTAMDQTSIQPMPARKTLKKRV
jgi:hypothetical protein